MLQLFAIFPNCKRLLRSWIELMFNPNVNLNPSQYLWVSCPSLLSFLLGLVIMMLFWYKAMKCGQTDFPASVLERCKPACCTQWHTSETKISVFSVLLSTFFLMPCQCTLLMHVRCSAQLMLYYYNVLWCTAFKKRYIQFFGAIFVHWADHSNIRAAQM